MQLSSNFHLAYLAGNSKDTRDIEVNWSEVERASERFPEEESLCLIPDD